MPLDITISGTTYPIPVQGDDPPWGDELTNAISALADVLNTLNGTGDILTTSFNVANNQSSAANITGLNFDPSIVRGAVVTYSIYRSSGTPTELSETGHIYLSYKTTAGSWEIAQNYSGNSGVVFTITAGGQLQYTSSDIGAASYVGKLKFKASAFVQT